MDCHDCVMGTMFGHTDLKLCIHIHIMSIYEEELLMT